jgi:aldehyde dehydrogenase (NAD+)
MGRGSEVGQVLLDDKRVNAISFTGSVATGQRIAQACVARMAKFSWRMA